MIISKEEFQKLLERDYNNYKKSLQVDLNTKIKPKDYLKKIFFSILSGKVKWEAPTEKLDPTGIKNIAILRYDAIGDYFVTTGAIRWLKKAIPNVKIDVITSHRNNMLAENDPFVDEALPIKFAPNFDLSMLQIRNYGKMKKYDLVVALIFSKNTKSAIMSTLLAKRAKKISVYHSKRYKIYGLVFDRQPDVSIPGLSWSEKMTKCVSDSITPLAPVGPEDGEPYVFIKKDTYQNILPVLDKYNLNYALAKEDVFLIGDFNPERTGKPYVVINISGTELNRIWSSENCIDYCTRFLESYKDYYVFISGPPAESDRIKQIIETVNNERCVQFKSGLLEFIAFVAGSNLVITPDTGVTHFAAAAKRPVIVFFAEEYKLLLWFPHNTKSVLLLTPDKSTINKIKTEDVLKATDMMLTSPEVE